MAYTKQQQEVINSLYSPVFGEVSPASLVLSVPRTETGIAIEALAEKVGCTVEQVQELLARLSVAFSEHPRLMTRGRAHVFVMFRAEVPQFKAEAPTSPAANDEAIPEGADFLAYLFGE